MIRPPLAPAKTDPDYRRFRDQLFVTTQVDPFVFAIWLRENLEYLREYFNNSGEPRDQMGAWLRMEYKRRAAMARRRTTPLPPVAAPAATTTSPSRVERQPAGSLIDFFYEMARRKLL